MKKQKEKKPSDASKYLLHPYDVLIFVRVGERIGKGRSIKVIADELHIPSSSISQSLKRLESRLGVTLISRSARRGTGELTDPGHHWLQKFREALVVWESLNKPDAKMPVCIAIASTQFIRSHILVAAEAAYTLRLRTEDMEDRAKIRIDELDYPDIMRGLRTDKYPFAVGWELDSRVYSDIEMTTLLPKVEFDVVVWSENPDKKEIKRIYIIYSMKTPLTTSRSTI